MKPCKYKVGDLVLGITNWPVESVRCVFRVNEVHWLSGDKTYMLVMRSLCNRELGHLNPYLVWEEQVRPLPECDDQVSCTRCTPEYHQSWDRIEHKIDRHFRET